MKQVFSFRGQYTRKQFWLTQLGIIIFLGVMTTLTILYLNYEGYEYTHDDITGVAGLWSILAWWTMISTWAKRFRDLDKSPYLALLFFIPIISFFAFLYIGFAGTKKRSTS